MQDNKGFLTTRELPYCPGCSHRIVNIGLSDVLTDLGLSPEEVIVVSDIGCVGLLDKYFRCHTVHTLHGRSTAIASGLRLVDSARPPYIVVAIGDGGATIGLLHLVEAARYDLDITVLIHNNFLYGMTGGQHSGLTPEGFRTRTTPDGSPIPGLKVLKILREAGASFVARVLAQSKELKETIAQGIEHQGFSVIEILELCTAYAMPWNKLTGKKLKELALSQGWELGILHRESHKPKSVEQDTKELHKLMPIQPKYNVKLNREYSILLAGSAGEGVQSAARWFTIALNLCGLYTSQKNDNPVTVGSGYSTSVIKISSQPIVFSGLESPDSVIITSQEGYREILSLKETWEVDPEVVIADETIEMKDTGRMVFYFPLRRFGKRTLPNILGILTACEVLKMDIPTDALVEASNYTKYPDLVKKALRLARGILQKEIG